MNDRIDRIARFSITQVTTECEQRMVGDHLTFLHSECKPMVEKELKDDLKNMYRLLKPIQGAQQVLLDEVQSHIKHQGLEAISGLKDETLAIDFVENVLSVHTRYKNLIVDVFAGDQTFIGAMDKAMTQVINNRQPKSPAKAPELVSFCSIETLSFLFDRVFFSLCSWLDIAILC